MLVLNSVAQEMLGIVNSNYAGLNAMRINPANTANNKLAWEINFVTFDAFLENNDLYIPGVSALSLYKRLDVDGEFLFVSSARHLTELRPGETHDLVLLDNFKGETKESQAYINLLVQGPSLMFTIGPHSFSLYNALRTNASISNVDYSLAKFGYESLIYRPLHDQVINAKEFQVNVMSWFEFGINYGTLLASNDVYRIKAGITPKYLTGLFSMYFLNQGMTYSINENDPNNTFGDNLDGDFVGVDATYGYAGLNESNRNSKLLIGKGFGLDLGVAYEYIEDQENEYRWRLGASLLDFGSINFDTDAKAISINETASWGRIDTIDVSRVSEFDSLVSAEFYNGDQTASQVGNTFTMGLPMAVSVQGDYKMADHWFVNITIVQRLAGKNKPRIHRENQLSVSPRYERRWWEITTPLVLHEYNRFRMGAAIRLAYLTVGSDKVHALFVKHDLTGFDLYATLRFWIDKGMLGGKGYKRGRGRSPKGAIPCFEW